MSFGQEVLAVDFSGLDYQKARNTTELCKMAYKTSCELNAAIGNLKSIKIKIKNKTYNGEDIYKLVDNFFSKKINKKLSQQAKEKELIKKYSNLSKKLEKIYNSNNLTPKKKVLVGQLFIILKVGLENHQEKLEKLIKEERQAKVEKANKKNLKSPTIIKRGDVYRTETGEGMSTSHFSMSEEEKYEAAARDAREQRKMYTTEDVTFRGASEAVYWNASILSDMRFGPEDLVYRTNTLGYQSIEDYNTGKKTHKGFNKEVIERLKADYKKTYNILNGGAMTDDTVIKERVGGPQTYKQIFEKYLKDSESNFATSATKQTAKTLKALGYGLDSNGHLTYDGSKNTLINKIHAPTFSK